MLFCHRAALHWARAACLQFALIAAVLVSPAHADSSRLRIEGSTTLLPAVQRLAKTYLKAHPDVVMEVHGGGSAEGIRALLEGDADVASASRYLTDGELELARLSGIFPVPFRIAYDAVIPIVHKSNRIRSLTLGELAGIYRGDITNWQQVGGADRNIGLVVREPGSGTQSVWTELVTTSDESLANLTVAGTGAQVVRTIADHKGSIGYIGLGNINANVKPLRVDGVMGSLTNVRTGTYPLGRDLFLFTSGWPDGHVLKFIDDALNPDEGQQSIGDAGFVPLYDHSNH